MGHSQGITMYGYIWHELDCKSRAQQVQIWVSIWNEFGHFRTEPISPRVELASTTTLSLSILLLELWVRIVRWHIASGLGNWLYINAMTMHRRVRRNNWHVSELSVLASEDIMTDHHRRTNQHKPCREFETYLISVTNHPASIAPVNEIVGVISSTKKAFVWLSPCQPPNHSAHVKMGMVLSNMQVQPFNR
jgi:hypothetical protein